MAVIGLLWSLTGCGSSTEDSAATNGTIAVAANTQTSGTAAPPEDSGTSEATDEGESDDSETASIEPMHEDFESAVFDNPTAVDNEWFPLNPGNRLVLDGFTVEDGETLDHRIEFVVTDLTKEILGVQTVVAWIEDYSDDELVEAELAFYAQDNDGNVWFFGEYPEEYEDGEFVAAPTWIPGVEEARPGIQMYADPHPDIPHYFQGWGPSVEWSDFGRVEALGEETCVELDCFEVLIIAESSLEEEDIFQLKSYARGVGNVQVDFRGDDETQEQLEVVEFGPISPDELEEYRALALAMEASAYEISPDVYGTTPPLS